MKLVYKRNVSLTAKVGTLDRRWFIWLGLITAMLVMLIDGE